MIETIIKSLFGFLFACTILFCFYVAIKDEIQKRRRNSKNKHLNTVQ